MTFRVTLGVDPGQTGAIAVLADGEPAGFIDMPIMARKAGGNEINCAELAARLRGVLQSHPGAAFMAVLESVHAMPKQGISSAFRFGESLGALKGIIAALGIPYRMVQPERWKKHLSLIGTDKDVARSQAIQRFPSIALQLARKKDIGRADALLIALWAQETEAIAA